LHHSPKERRIAISGLGGDEAFCLHYKGFEPGHLVVGNSVQSMGFLGGLSAGLRNMAGGESADVTRAVKEGRDAALQRMVAEAQQVRASGITGVSSELKTFDGNIEFLSTGSAVHRAQAAEFFSSSFDGKELYCALDAGYKPRKFVFGNIAYSVGVAQGFLGSLKTMVRGEIKEFSDVLNATRHLAFRRMTDEAARAGANAVIGVEVDVTPFQGFHEMLVTGTAANHPALTGFGNQQPVTCDLTCDELWSMARLGYAPVQVVMGTAVYSLGVFGGLKAMFRSLSRGEIPELTSLVYDAREHALDLLEEEALDCRADKVLGTDVFVHDLGNGLVEFMAIGTAVKRMSGIATESPALPAQAVAIHRRTFRSSDDVMLSGGSVKE
jgi:uncharacterized protein YbjQ (UPF0145 family)